MRWLIPLLLASMTALGQVQPPSLGWVDRDDKLNATADENTFVNYGFYNVQPTLTSNQFRNGYLFGTNQNAIVQWPTNVVYFSQNNATNFTMACTYYSRGNNPSVSILFGSFGGSPNPRTGYMMSTFLVYFAADANIWNTTLNSNMWLRILTTKSGSTTTTYTNTGLVQTGSWALTGGTGDPTGIGAWTGRKFPTDSDIASVYFIPRVLTASEIKLDYEVEKARHFGKAP